MREYVPALRSLLAGDEVTTSGTYVTLDRVRLDWPPTTPPGIVVAGEGPKTVHLTGEVGDGTVLPGGSNPDRVARTLARALEGRAAAGRVELETGDVEEGLNAAAAIGDDRLQRMSTGRVVPERFTHGSSEQRVQWFRRGLESGNPDTCDTFGSATD